jgi:hypothetical protein
MSPRLHPRVRVSLTGFWDRQQARAEARRQYVAAYAARSLPLGIVVRRIEPTFQTPRTFETWQRIRRAE